MADGVFERLGIAHLAERPITQVSGGERQLGLIARALMQAPRFIVLDRPGSLASGAYRCGERTFPTVMARSSRHCPGRLKSERWQDCSHSIRQRKPDTRFRANFVHFGISAGFGISFTLPRVVGTLKARDILLTGRRVAGEEALALGLLDRLVEGADLDRAAVRVAEDMAAAAPTAVRATRRLIGLDERATFEAAVRRELIEQAPLLASPDFEEGVTAARERRTPNFATEGEACA